MQPPPADPRRPAREAAHAALKAATQLQTAGRTADAEAAFRRALAIDPHSAQACNNLGHHLLAEGRTSEAEALFRHALRIRPHYARALLNLGCILGQRSAQAQEAVAMLEEATRLEPDLFHAWNNLGTALTTLCQAEAAEAAYRHAMTLEPRNPAAPLNLGALFFAAGRPAEAETWFRQALALDPGMAEARINLCFALLAQGRLREAWPLHATRAGIARTKSQTHWPDLPMPHWQGEPLAGKSIMVWPEQGYGDYIQFVRFVGALRARGASRITLVCTPPLHALLETVEGVDRVVSGVADVPAHDYWAFVMSLPQGLDIGLEDIPAALPYIRAPADRLARWRGFLPAGAADGLRVGLAWKGSAGHRNDANRSLPGLATLAPLWSVPGVRFVGLQKGKLPGQEDPDALAPPAGQPMLSVGPGMADFADLAAVVDQLDLVITVDTAVAHVAGALGKPVWVLLPAWGTDWRWMQDREDSPWYPGVMRLFRQRRHGDWAEVVERVTQALAGFSSERAPAKSDGVREADRLVREGRLEEAAPLLRRIVADGRASARAHHLLAHIVSRQGDAREAEAHYRAGLALDDRQAGLHSDLGVLLMNAGRLPEAEACYRRAVALDPACIEAWMNLAVMARFSGRFAESEADWREALRLDPSRPVARVGLGHLLLAVGRLEEAWPWLRARHDPVFDRFGTRVPQLPFPRWEGGSLQGRSILLWPEQGMGDVIQFARYASLLHGLGATRVTLAAPAALVEVLRTLADVDAVVVATDPVAPHDTWAFLMDLPDRLGTTLASLPARVPYLRADAERVRAWRPRLPADRLRVGLVWKGAPVNPNDTQRSLPDLATLAPLWRVADVAFVSLQKGAAEAEAAQPPEGQPLVALGPGLRDFADTAAVIDSLDLVIGVDTSVLHLAAALGKPAWILLPAWGTDWRWLVDRDDSPWYPGVVRLFRQSVVGDWGPPVEALAVALAARARPAQHAGMGPPATAATPAGPVLRLPLAIRAGRVVRPGDRTDAGTAVDDLATAAGLAREGRLEDAEARYRQLLARDPADAGAHNDLAVLLQQRQRLDEAESHYRLALKADPRHLQALSNLGSLLIHRLRPRESEPLLRQALSLAPDSLTLLNNLAVVLDNLGRSDEAESTYARALDLDPDHPGTLCNLGFLLMNRGRLNEAERHLRRALHLQPRMTEALVNLGFLLRGQDRLDEAEAAYRHALTIEPGHALAELNLCFVQLAQGRLREAWPLHGARLKALPHGITVRPPRFAWPVWRGEPLTDRSLVVWCEQGLGDAIQFLRYARLLRQRGLAQLTVVCPPSLAPLLRTLEGVDTVEVNVAAVKPHDFWVLLMDLPERFDTTLETIPATLPYLHPDPERVARWSTRLPPGRRIGLVWRGSPGHRHDIHRSLPSLAALAPLWQVGGLQYVSLQRGAGEDEAAQPPAGQPVTAVGPLLDDFADTAAVIAQLDLVICVDTAVAHLAGALGKPAWLLLPRLGTDWRWLTGREDSPWYPGVMRLFRQRNVGDWAEVVDRVAQALDTWAARPDPAAALPSPAAADLIVAAAGQPLQLQLAIRTGRVVRPEQAEQSRLADEDYAAATRLWRAGQLEQAEVLYRQALQRDPSHASAHNNLANLMRQQRRMDEAEAQYRMALAADPRHLHALTNLGSLLAMQRRPDEGEPLLREALALAPDSVDVLSNLGTLLDDVGRRDEAEALYGRALALDPDHAGALSNLGSLLMHQGRLEEAERHIRRALTLKPDMTEALINLAFLLRAQGRPAEAEATYRSALSIEPGNSLAELNLCFLLLAQGRLREAWPLHGSRLQPQRRQVNTRPPEFSWPQWRGESLQGRSLVIWPEQGLGDAIQFLRYARLLKQRGLAQLTVVCQPSLAPLLRTLEGVDTVEVNVAAVKPHDFWVLLMDLPERFDTTLETIPADLPYLRPDPARVARWSPRLPAGRRVGLVWRGSPGHRNDAHRSLPGLATLAPLWTVRGVQFVSLQKGAGEDESARPPEGQPLADLGRHFGDFADAAAVISQLDLVICVDTSVAHLAGALGKPVWLLLPRLGTDWRWLTDREDSPWYPGVMRLFRQRVVDDWAEVVNRIAQALPGFLATVRPQATPEASIAADREVTRALAMAGKGKRMLAEVAYRRALAIAPGHVGALNNLAVLLAAQGRAVEAEACWREALAVHPDDGACLYNFGSHLADSQRQDEALGLLRRAALAWPENASVRNNLARLLDRMGRLDEALAEYTRAHALAPRHAGVLANHAAALMAAGRAAQAEPLLREAITIAPDAVDLQASLALALRALDRPREAESLLREALAREPAHIPARLGLALLLLAEGRFQEAWPFYEARHEGPAPASGSPAPPDAAFRWKGEPLAGGTLVIWHEQGFGDAIQFIRYAALAKARAAARVVVSCPASLAALFASADGVDGVFTQPSACPPMAAWAWLGDLPRLLDTTLASIPAPLPYLHADPERLQRWAPRLPPGRRAGLVWKGRADYANDAHRSLPGLHTLAPLWQVPGWSFVSLQKGPGAEEAMDPPDAQPLRALGHDLDDFADAAALIDQLDLVITVDTAVAHLAGALGKPVWVLLPAQGTDWRWMTGRDDSPWYPGVMRLFRQRQPLAWADVVSEVAQALAGFTPPMDRPTVPAGDADARYQRGNALRDAGQWREAAAAYQEAIALHPGHPGAHHNLGVVRQALGDTARAMAAYRRALALVPDHAITLTNLGSLLLEAGQLDEAESLLRAAIRSQPDYAKPLLYLADLLARRQSPDAEAAYQAALACNPGWAQAHSHWGAWLARAGRWAEAEASLRAALDRDANSVDAWINLAALLGDLHRDGESEAAWHEALRRAPGHPRARLGLGLHLLRLGRFAEAWPFHAARHDPAFRHFGTTPPTPAWPRWSGEPLAGRSLVIWPEQGHGDLLQFIRYAPLLKTMGLARLTVLCRPELAALVRAVEGVDAVVTDEAALPAHDLWAFLMDLPERVGTTLATLPARLPYLHADEARRARWRPVLPQRPRIGLVWRGRPAHDNDAHRSLASLAMLAPLWAAAAGRARFVSLQKGAGEDEALSSPPEQPLLALGHRCADFADAAAVVAELDLVITVDTAMAHLAGGLGKPVWVLLPAHGGDWRWFHERSDSPWYPGVMRLFRQPLDEAGWSGTVDRVAGELAQWLAARLGTRAPDAQALPPTAVPAPDDAARSPSTPEALFHQAALKGAAGDHAGAEAAYREGLALQPDHVGALNNLGLLLVHRGALAEAEAVYRRGLAAEPAQQTLLLNLGTLLGDLRRNEEAESLLRRAAQARPASAKPLNNLGRLLARTGRAAEAEAAYREAIALDAGHQSAARTNLAILLARSGRFDEAEALAREAVNRQPTVAEHWLGLGSVLRHARRDAEAEAALRRALALQPAHATAQLALSHLLLAQGRFEEGFALHGARRLWRPGSAMAVAPELPWPEWTGQPLQGRAIVVWQEQGLGDALQFVRFASLLKPLGAARVTLHCHPTLAPLMQGVDGIDAVITRPQDGGPHDYWVMLLDLPRLLGTTVDRIPAPLPYLHADPARVARWAPHLPAGLKVGLVWRGAPGQENDDLRSLPALETLAPLWRVPDLRFVSLQKGEGEAQALHPPAGQSLTALGHGFEDMMDTAAVVSQLDLVITVCTSVAHLAGALGKPTWVLLPAIGADWRWLLDRDDSPWYPGVMRLFRSQVPGDWTAAVAAVGEALAAWRQGRA